MISPTCHIANFCWLKEILPLHTHTQLECKLKDLTRSYLQLRFTTDIHVTYNDSDIAAN